MTCKFKIKTRPKRLVARGRKLRVPWVARVSSGGCLPVGSVEVSTYVHLSGRNIDNALLKLNGIKTEDEVNSEEHVLRIKMCLRCQESNSPASGFCSRCGCPLDVRTAMLLHEEESKTDNVMDWLTEDPEYKELVRSKLRLGLSAPLPQVIIRF